MYWILLVMALLAATVVALIVGGLATPRKHVVARGITLSATPDTVWTLVHDVERYPEWRADVRRVERVVEDDDRLRWREIGRQGSVTYEATIEEAPRHFGARIIDEDLPYSGEWQWELVPAGAGTRLVVTERGEVGNPVFRFLAAHVFGHTRTIDAYLLAVARRFGEPSEPAAAVN